MSYGFRIYKLRATLGPGRIKGLDVANPTGDGSRLIDRLSDAVHGLRRKGLLSGVPNLQYPSSWEEAPAQPGDVQIEFEEPIHERPDHLLIRARYGFLGEYTDALSPAGNLSLLDKSAAIPFRALIALPAAGPDARLVVETKGRTCPVTAIISWLGRWEYQQSVSAGETHWVRLRATQMADAERLRRLIHESETVTAELVQKRSGAPGERSGERVELNIKTSERIKKEGFIRTLLGPLNHQFNDGYVQEIERVAGLDPEDLDRMGLRFNKAKIRVENADGESKLINPEAIRARFTYPVSQDLRPDDVTWLRSVYRELQGPLSAGTDIQV